MLEEFPDGLHNLKKVYSFKAVSAGTEVMLFSSPPIGIFSEAHANMEMAMKSYRQWLMDPHPNSKQWNEISVIVINRPTDDNNNENENSNKGNSTNSNNSSS